jgi:hypothetical protein
MLKEIDQIADSIQPKSVAQPTAGVIARNLGAFNILESVDIQYQ